ncbi:hypothetical protein DFAR_2210018 [Desulfarculales bacterium]
MPGYIYADDTYTLVDIKGDASQLN